jgi:toxin ParE1/3/4
MTKYYKVQITSSVIYDIQEIIDYIAEDNAAIALEILDRLENKINSLKEYPERGRVVPELLNQNIMEYHEIIETPWRIIYKIMDLNVFILTVLDGRRNVQDILLRKLMNKGN